MQIISYFPRLLSFGFDDGLGWEKGSTNEAMQELIGRVKGPFTPLQWMELEHQALIYKYINAKAPVPSSLLFSICRKLADPSMARSLGNNRGNYGLYQIVCFAGWGLFHYVCYCDLSLLCGRCVNYQTIVLLLAIF